MAGKHVFVEKPIASTAEEARRLVDEAAKRKLVLAVDHTFVHTGAVQKMREIVESGLGDMYYYDSVRVNLGLFQHDVSVIWDLAVHDLSIMDYVLPREAGRGLGHRHEPCCRRAGEHRLSQPVLPEQPDRPYPRQLAGAGEGPPDADRRVSKMIVYDDLEPTEKIKVYDKGITLNGDPKKQRREGLPDAGRLPHRRHVGAAARRDRGARHRAARVRRLHRASQDRPIADGQAGLRVVRILEAATQSLAQRGRVVELEPARCVA